MIDKVKLIPLNVVIVFVAVDDGAVILGDVPQLICLKPELGTCFRKVLFKKKIRFTIQDSSRGRRTCKRQT